MSDTSPATAAPSTLECPNGARIAYHRSRGRLPGVVFLGGFASDMTGTKALALEAWAAERSRAFLRFDYRGHGRSSGSFAEGCVGDWADDAVAALDRLTEGPQILVGSSMGGWIMLLAALARPGRVAALVGIAAAPDFTEDLMWARFPPAVRRAIETDGVWRQPSPYGPEPTTITRRLIEDGRTRLLLRAPLAVHCPVRLLQGMADPDVPWQHAIRLAEHLPGGDVQVRLIKDGDHRLSRPEDLAALTATLDELLEGAAALR